MSRYSGNLSRPAPGAQINCGTPLCRGLKALVVWNEGAGAPVELVRRSTLTLSGNPTWAANSDGTCGRANAVTDYWNLGPADNFLNEARATILAIHRKTDSTNRAAGHFGLNESAAGKRAGGHVPYSDGTVYWDFGGQSSPNRLTASGLSFTGIQKWVFVAGTKGSAIYRNGLLVASSATAITRVGSAADYAINKGNGSPIDGDLMDWMMFAILDAEWGQGEVKAWTDDPYSMLQRAPLRMYVPVGMSPASSYKDAMPEVFAGPPMRGAAWLGRLPIEHLESRRPQLVGCPFKGPPVYARHMPEVSSGPAMRDAPWIAYRLPIEPAVAHPPPAERTAAELAVPMPEVKVGPPMRGGPLPILIRHEPVVMQGPVRPSTRINLTAQPFLERAPDIRTTHGMERLRRATEKLHIIVNSLMAQGFITQEEGQSYFIRGGGYVLDRNPSSIDDVTSGFFPGSVWVNETTEDVFVCVSNARSNATWRVITS